MTTDREVDCDISNGCKTPLTPSNELDPKELDVLLQKRMQPIYELVESERTYVSSLKLIAEKYIPLKDEPLLGLDVPEALIQKWRILWGNWLQLAEWHQKFLERLDNLILQNDIERIPLLFIDSQMRLRSNYSKYCENHRKAALIAEQHRDFFEEVRVRISDKQDVVSHLMKPVQRIMRYQLPMEAIVKCTERAKLPSTGQWSTALNIMKEIPGDTQLILEAARIDGYPGTVTSLGKVRIRDDLLVATLTPNEYATMRSQPSFTAAFTSQSHSSFHSDINGGGGQGEKGSSPADPTTPSSSSVSGANATDTVNNASSSSATDVVKFFDRRVFLFDQSLLFTEEIKPKKNNQFAQSTFQFKGFVNVNKMRFEPRLYGTGVDGGGRSLLNDSAEDELKFVIHDISPGRQCTYIINPGTKCNHDAWLRQMGDIQNMQQELLLALQDPTKFSRENPNEKDEFYSRLPLDRSSSALGNPGEFQHVRGKSDSGCSTVHKALKSNSTVTEPKLGKLATNRPAQPESRIHLPTFHRKKSTKEGTQNELNPALLNHARKESCPESTTLLEDTVERAVIVAAGVALHGELDSDLLGTGSATKPRSWSGFSFRLPKTNKRDKAAPISDLFRHHEAPAHPSASGSASGHVKKRSNVFKNLFKSHKPKSGGAAKE